MKEVFNMKIWRICIMALCAVMMTMAVAAAQTPQTVYQMRDNSFKLDYAQGKYPSVLAADSILTKVKINTEIEKTVSSFVEDIKARRAKGEDVTGWVSYEMKSAVWNQLAVDSRAGGYIQFTTRPNEQGMFSIVIYCSSMYKGAAHPSTYAYTLTFDEKGNLVTWNDLLAADKASGHNFLTVDNLRKAVLTQAKDKIFSPSEIKIDKFTPAFFVDDAGGIHALFQQYDIAPYAAGFVDVVYPDK